LLLLAITLLVTNALQGSLLEVKMSTNFHTRELAFQDAEKKLLTKELLLKSGKISDAQIISRAICGVVFYKLLASDQTNTIHLQSTYAIVGDTSKCEIKPNFETGRQSWRFY
jgi:Tfp pilus assembly protein PilX